jgi:hypothetical protein
MNVDVVEDRAGKMSEPYARERVMMRSSKGRVRRTKRAAHTQELGLM